MGRGPPFFGPLGLGLGTRAAGPRARQVTPALYSVLNKFSVAVFRPALDPRRRQVLPPLLFRVLLMVLCKVAPPFLSSLGADIVVDAGACPSRPSAVTVHVS